MPTDDGNQHKDYSRQDFNAEALEARNAVCKSAQQKMQELLQQSEQALASALKGQGLQASQQRESGDKKHSRAKSEAEQELNELEMLPGKTWRNVDHQDETRRQLDMEQGVQSINNFNEKAWESVRDTVTAQNFSSKLSEISELKQHSGNMLESILRKLDENHQVER